MLQLRCDGYIEPQKQEGLLTNHEQRQLRASQKRQRKINEEKSEEEEETRKPAQRKANGTGAKRRSPKAKAKAKGKAKTKADTVPSKEAKQEPGQSKADNSRHGGSKKPRASRKPVPPEEKARREKLKELPSSM